MILARAASGCFLLRGKAKNVGGLETRSYVRALGTLRFSTFKRWRKVAIYLDGIIGSGI
jgi:hypothetical protein